MTSPQHLKSLSTFIVHHSSAHSLVIASLVNESGWFTTHSVPVKSDISYIMEGDELRDVAVLLG